MIRIEGTITPIVEIARTELEKLEKRMESERLQNVRLMYTADGIL